MRTRAAGVVRRLGASLAGLATRREDVIKSGENVVGASASRHCACAASGHRAHQQSDRGRGDPYLVLLGEGLITDHWTILGELGRLRQAGDDLA